MTALLKKGTGNADRLSISGKDALSYSYQIYGFDGDDILKGGKKTDFLSGGNGNDSLYSGIGNDVLFGGKGADTFIFNTALGNSSIIRDFNPAEDKIQLDMSVFSKLSSGVLNSANFVRGSTANDVNDYLIYNSSTGVLSYDEDGSGANSSSMLAQLSPNLSLSNANFLVSLPTTTNDSLSTLSAFGNLSSDQGNFSITSKQIYTKNSDSSLVSQAMNAAFSGLFGDAIDISKLNVTTTTDGNIVVSGLLSNGQRLTVILGSAKNISIDYLISGGMDLGKLTDLEFLKGFGLSSAEFVLSSEGVTVDNPTVGATEVGAGATIIGTIDLSTSSNQALKFMRDHLGIKSLVGYLSLDPEEGVAFTAELNADITLIKSGVFSIKETQVALSASSDGILVPKIGISNTIEITGYDPTQSNEPTLALTGGVEFDPKSVTISANIDAVSAWKNPFGFQGASIRSLGFQVGATYITGIDNIGFVESISWGNYDIDLAFSIGITDPEKIAFTFTLNKPISVIELFAQMNAMVMGPAAMALVDVAGPLFDQIPFTIVSIDTDNDGALDPLVSFVPFATSIGNYDLPQGFGIAGRVRLFGVDGTMALQANSDFTAISGSLAIKNLDRGWITISGTQPGTDLTASFEISAARQYLKGDGKITMFGQTLAQAHFEFSPTSISITDTQFGLGDILALKVKYLEADLASMLASGNAELVMFGYSVASMDFEMNKSHLKFQGDIDLSVVSISAGFEWNFDQSSLAASGTMKINNEPITKTTITYNVNDGLILKGDLGVNVEGFGNVGVTVSTTVKNGTVADISIDASLGTLGDVGFSVNPSSFSIKDLVKTLTDKTLGSIGALSEWAANAVKEELTSAYNEVAHFFTNNEVTNTIKNVANSAVNEVISWFSPHKDKNYILVDTSPNGNNDSWERDSGNDTFFCNGGNDFVSSKAGNDLIDGGSGNDTLWAASGNDKVDGGTGDDQISPGEGSDTAYGGFGNDNITDENYATDFLHGGMGNDTIYGSGGGDVINGGGDNDIIYGANAADSTYLNDDDVLHGDDGNDTLYGANGLDKLYGDGGNDVMYGDPTNLTNEVYADSLYGGLGDDTYYWTSTDSKDYFEEKVNEGIDTVVSTALSYTLPNNIENLWLSGTFVILGKGISGTGNGLNNGMFGNGVGNSLSGGAGNDFLSGREGNDTLVGGSGNDIFEFIDLSKDTITDFSVTDDTIYLLKSVFTKFTTSGMLNASNFVINASALDNNDYLIYNKTTGTLSYDTDANGSTAPTPIALLSANLALTNADFYIN